MGRALAAGCLVALVALNSGCQSGKAPATPPVSNASSSAVVPTSAAPTPAAASSGSVSASASAAPSASTASPSATLSGDQLTLWNKLQEYNAVMNKIMEDPNSDMTKLYTVARDTQAQTDVKSIMAARTKGERQVGDWIFSNPRVDNSDQGKATVTVCIDTMNSKFLDKSGKDIGTHRRVTQAYWLTQDAKTMAWYVTDAEIKAQTC